MDTKTRLINKTSARDPLHTQGHIQTESEGMEKDLYANGNQKKIGVAILNMITNRVENKDYYKRQRRTLYSNQGINPKRYNYCK